MDRKKMIISTLALLLVAAFFLIGISREDRQVAQKLAVFNNAEINGKLVAIDVMHHGTSFRIDNRDEKFLFYPQTDKALNEGKVFLNFAKKGDSVIKNAHTNVLVLVKNGKRYYYRFQQMQY